MEVEVEEEKKEEEAYEEVKQEHCVFESELL